MSTGGWVRSTCPSVARGHEGIMLIGGHPLLIPLQPLVRHWGSMDCYRIRSLRRYPSGRATTRVDLPSGVFLSSRRKTMAFVFCLKFLTMKTTDSEQLPSGDVWDVDAEQFVCRTLMKPVPSIVIQAKPITPRRSSNIHVGKSLNTDGNGDLLLMQRMPLLCLFAISGSKT